MPNWLGTRGALVAYPQVPMLVAEMHLPRDAAFKRFVHWALFVRHLLRTHSLPGVDEARVLRIEQVRANLVGPDLSRRLADGVWWLTLRDGELVHVMLECQSEPDPPPGDAVAHAARGRQCSSDFRAIRQC